MPDTFFFLISSHNACFPVSVQIGALLWVLRNEAERIGWPIWQNIVFLFIGLPSIYEADALHFQLTTFGVYYIFKVFFTECWPHIYYSNLSSNEVCEEVR